MSCRSRPAPGWGRRAAGIDLAKPQIRAALAAALATELAQGICGLAGNVAVVRGDLPDPGCVIGAVKSAGAGARRGNCPTNSAGPAATRIDVDRGSEENLRTGMRTLVQHDRSAVSGRIDNI
jgi:hypothetical protein